MTALTWYIDPKWARHGVHVEYAACGDYQLVVFAWEPDDCTWEVRLGDDRPLAGCGASVSLGDAKAHAEGFARWEAKA